jgi:hypothetical protein
MFVSSAQYYAGMPTDSAVNTGWGRGELHPYLIEGGAWQGTDAFRGASEYVFHMNTYRNATEFALQQTSGIIDIEGYTDDAEAYQEIQPGDVYFIDDPSPEDWDHLAIIVGFGGANPGDQPAPFYPTYEDAVRALGPDVRIVPYAVDHGGAEPQFFPRPITAIRVSNNEVRRRIYGLDYGD